MPKKVLGVNSFLQQKNNDYKKANKNLKKEIEKLRERIKTIVSEKQEVEILNKDLRKDIRILTEKLEGNKTEMEILYETINELNEELNN